MRFWLLFRISEKKPPRRLGSMVTCNLCSIGHEAGRCVIAVAPQRGQHDRAKYRAKRISQANKLAQSDHCTALTTAHR
jgi:hypothetical protein